MSRLLRSLWALVLLSTSVHAGGVQDDGAPWVSALEMPRGTAMGGAQSAIATSNDALVVNPAGLSTRKKYHVQLDGLWDQKFPGQGVNISIADSSSLALGTGLLWQRYGVGEPGGRGEGWLLGLGYAYPAGGYNFGGMTKLLRFDSPSGEIHTWAQDFGILANHGSFAWSMVIQNLSTEDIPLFPRVGTIGVAFGSDTDYRLAFDYKVDLTDTSHLRHKLASGLEVLVDQSIALRAGYTWSPTFGQQWVSAGIGLVTDKVGLSLAWRRRIVGPLDQFLQAAVTLYLE